MTTSVIKRTTGKATRERPMVQLAIRFPDAMLREIDAIIAARHGQAERTGVIRELVAEALAQRRKGTGRA